MQAKLWYVWLAIFLISIGIPTSSDAQAQPSTVPTRMLPKAAKAQPSTPMPKALKARPNEAQTQFGNKNTFQSVDISKSKAQPGWDHPYLLAAYGLVWLVLLVYLVGLAARLRKTEEDVQRLEKRLRAGD